MFSFILCFIFIIIFSCNLIKQNKLNHLSLDHRTEIPMLLHWAQHSIQHFRFQSLKCHLWKLDFEVALRLSFWPKPWVEQVVVWVGAGAIIRWRLCDTVAGSGACEPVPGVSQVWWRPLALAGSLLVSLHSVMKAYKACKQGSEWSCALCKHHMKRKPTPVWPCMKWCIAYICNSDNLTPGQSFNFRLDMKFTILTIALILPIFLNL